ncbi:TIMELESS-interacting protein [Senna tora]|uniref:TIMELESS-interacting protein n=1 Tax=Senna tora TaxID=362788 RepID=A0A834WKL6_9FABA|nr:TIMELESS-interacting protein [Senna tora]
MDAAPTGCYKCGRPGHWSRDCPFSPSNDDNSSSIKASGAAAGASSSGGGSGSGPSASKFAHKPAEKPKRVPRTRPKLTPELLLSEDGLGYVLRYFPRAFKYRGRGNEVRDLGNLLELYSEWHSRLLPYYSFNQFVYKVEQVAATKRVKTCLRELRERVANGGDPTKLREPPVVSDTAADVHEAGESSHQQGDVFSESQNIENIQEDMLNEIFDKAIAEPSQNVTGASTVSIGEASNGVSDSGANLSGKAEITAEQRARIEANRLKALERRAARALSSQAP